MDICDLPKPVSDFLKVSDFSLEECLIDIKQFDKKFNWNDIRSHLVYSTMKKIRQYHGIDNSICDFPNHYTIPNEALKNAHYHGGNGKSIALEFGTFLTPVGITYSFCDGGLYFTKKDVKQHWEARKHHPEKHIINIRNVGFGVGTKTIYSICDLIFVDNERGMLFTGITRKNKYY